MVPLSNKPRRPRWLILLAGLLFTITLSTTTGSLAESEVVADPAPATGGPQSTPSRLPASDEKTSNVREPTAAELAREPALRERVQSRWQALIKGNFDRAYQFTTPGYRAAHDAGQYADSFGQLVTWHLASIEEVRYDQPAEAEVIVSLTISVPLGESGTVKTVVPVPERWGLRRWPLVLRAQPRSAIIPMVSSRPKFDLDR